jgi:hypothetical protein
MMTKHKLIFLILTISVSHLIAQATLRLTTGSFGKAKIYDVYNYEILEYKLKSDKFYRKNKIVHMQDSLILFDNETEIKLGDIKAIRFRNLNYLEVILDKFFRRAGILFLSLNTVNNIIIESAPVISPKPVLISMALFGTSFIIKELGTKRIRMRKNKNLAILDFDYKHLSIKN